MSPTPDTTRWTRRVLGLGLLTLAVAVVWWATSGDSGHRVVIVTSNAEDIVPGLRVRAAGTTVGTIEEASVTRDRRARLVLRVDDRVWPLPTDTKLELRFGGTIRYSDRYIELRRGRAAATIRDGGRLVSRNFTRPAEFDQVFRTFDEQTRGNLRLLIDRGGPALDAVSGSLPAALEHTPPAFAQVEAAFRDLSGDPGALDTLSRSSDSLVDAIHRANPGISSLVSDAGMTFDALAGESTALKGTLSETPGALDATRRVLVRADGTLNRLAKLSRDTRTGVARLRRVTGPLASTLAAVERVAPPATRTLRTLRTAAPDVDTFLSRLGELMPSVESIGRQGATQLACIRPYAPELGGFFSSWGPGAWGNSDGRDTYLRGQLGTFPFPDVLPFDTKTFTTLFPQVKVSFPRPPGDLAGQPWYQPQCGITATAYDPAADPERAGAVNRRGKDRP